ncbi:MAG: hypothetical protein ACREE9_10375, partial [Stellaceae bacterium]
MPGSPARRITGGLDNAANAVERLDLLAVLAERIFDLSLLEDGVDAAQPVGRGVGQRVEAAERVAEIAERLAVGPAALRFLGGGDGMIDR